MTEVTRWYEAPPHPIAVKGVTIKTYYGSATAPLMRVTGPRLTLDWLEQHYRLREQRAPRDLTHRHS